MNKIFFPGLNLELNISQIAFKIWNIEIYWYALLMVLAFVLAIVIFKIRDGKFNIKFDQIIDLIIYIIPISIISARLYYILFNLEYYLTFPLQIINFRSGGLAIYGGIIGRSYYLLHILQKKQIKYFRCIRLYSTMFSFRTSNRKMGKLFKCRSISEVLQNYHGEWVFLNQANI